MQQIIVPQVLGGFPEIKTAISCKSFGNQSFQHPQIPEQETILNRKRFFDELKINSSSVVNVGLCHGDSIYHANTKDRGRGALRKNSIIGGFDGLITTQAGLFLLVTVADCYPVFFYDPMQKCVALIHAGWRGIIKDITTSAVHAMIQNCGCSAENILVYIGPGIRSCHFEVQDEVANKFEGMFKTGIVVRRNMKKYIDLTIAIRQQLESAGIKSENIETSPQCTYCDNNSFSSYRRDAQKYVAQGAIIGMI